MAAANVDIYNQRMNIRSGAPPPSPPASIARSSNGHGLYSMHNGAPHPNNPNRFRIEDQLADHYFELKKYLTESANSDTSYKPHNRARDKLLRLSPIQFQELSTDVYDELLRRKDEYEIPRDPNNPANNVPKFLLPKNNFHPKRNQARQKLSTLAIKKFRELATDVLHELGRRFPQFQEPDFSRGSSPAGSGRGPSSAPQYPREMRRPSTSSGSQPPYSPAIIPGSSGSNDLNRPLPKTFQSNTMIPSKGTMVEDDDDHSAEDDAFDLEKDTQRSSRRTTNKSLPYSIQGDSAQVSQLERKVDELESQIYQKDEEVQRSKQDADKANSFLSDVERQLHSAQDLNSSLQREIDKLRAQGSGPNEYKSRYEDLQAEYDEQQRIMDEVRRETKQHLNEMRQLSEQHDKAAESEENLARKVSHLEAELNQWRDRYAKACTQPRDARYKSNGLLDQQHNATRSVEDGSLIDENGLVQDVSIKAYQIAVDDLLHKSRTSPPSEVLNHMRYVVECVRGVTKDVDVNAPTDTDGAKKRKKLKLRISGAANDLITTATRFSKAEEHFPISVLDVAVIKLTDAIMEFVAFVKIKPSGVAELDDEMNGFI